MLSEPSILAALDAALRSPRAARVLDAVGAEVSAELARHPDARLAWRTIPLDAYDRLPDGIASSWVFVLRAGCTSGAERHPNSIQHFISYRGAADMQLWGSPQPGIMDANVQASPVGNPQSSIVNANAWVSNHLISDPNAPLDRRALSIPVNVWHRPVMGDTDWVVVSFHTAADDQLIEERALDDQNPDAGPASSEPYAGRVAR